MCRCCSSQEKSNDGTTFNFLMERITNQSIGTRTHFRKLIIKKKNITIWQFGYRVKIVNVKHRHNKMFHLPCQRIVVHVIKHSYLPPKMRTSWSKCQMRQFVGIEKEIRSTTISFWVPYWPEYFEWKPLRKCVC